MDDRVSDARIEFLRGGRTPRARVRVINGRIDVAEVDFAHEAVYLETRAERGEHRRRRACSPWQGRRKREARLTFSCREKLAKRDWR